MGAGYPERNRLKALLDREIPDFAVRIGVSTTIDITRPSIDKAYGIRSWPKQAAIAYLKCCSWAMRFILAATIFQCAKRE